MYVVIHYASSDGEDNEVYGPFNTEREAKTFCDTLDQDEDNVAEVLPLLRAIA